MLIHRGRIMAVFLAVIKAADTAPDDVLLSPIDPCATAVQCAAFAADETI